eukprot:TRINITY_DN11925_c0_g3_i1.p1 TRINITY_DN11925_c0_g3~~TRINITY_DN11925_c0_g3_i1.p1  ORF type:complete len:229 (+),score=60.07 TRINITY_DN11925_c0_g3_i1:67-687(+)
MKKAETEAKGKNEKTGEIKKLTAHNASVITEKTKYEEQLNACLRYKHDLDKLTPDSWFREALINIRVTDEREHLREGILLKIEEDSTEYFESGKNEEVDERVEEQLQPFVESVTAEVNAMPMTVADVKDLPPGQAGVDPLKTVRGQLDAMNPDKVCLPGIDVALIHVSTTGPRKKMSPQLCRSFSTVGTSLDALMLMARRTSGRDS